MLNHVVVMGRLTKDPELKRTANGTPVTSFPIAVERDYRDQSGNRETDFFEIVAWKQAAEFVSKNFHKGKMAVIEGKLQAREWTDKNGNKKKSIEIIADHFYFADSKKEEYQTDYARQVFPNKPFDSIGEQPVQFDEIEGDGVLPF